MSIEKTQDGQYVLKAGDKTLTLTEEELYQRASKGFGAELKFEEAAKIREEAEKSLTTATARLQAEMQEMLQLADAGDVAAYEKVLDMIGVPANEKYERIRQFQEANVEEPVEEARPTAQKSKGRKESVVEPSPQLAAVQDLATAMTARGLSPEDVVEILQKADRSQKADLRKQIFTEMREVLDKDEKLGKMVSAGGPKAERLVELAQQRVKGRIIDGDRRGPDLYAKVLQEVKAIVEDFGAATEPTPTVGLGPSPFVSRMTSQAKEPPEPSSITSKDYGENVAQRLAHMLTQPDDE